MLESLKFVKGAVSRKDHVPALTHFQIKNGFVKGHNGTLTLCAPMGRPQGSPLEPASGGRVTRRKKSPDVSPAVPP